MSFSKPYWHMKNIEDQLVTHIIPDDSKDKEDSKNKDDSIVIIKGDFSYKTANKFASIKKKDFNLYANALMKVKYNGESNKLLALLDSYSDWFACYADFENYLKETLKCGNPLLYIDAPHVNEYKRYNFSSKKYLNIIYILNEYQGDWILTFKKRIPMGELEIEYEEEYREYFKKQLKLSENPIYEFDCSGCNISFITNINFDEISMPNFCRRYFGNDSEYVDRTIKKIELN
jgi:hypothetical protein